MAKIVYKINGKDIREEFDAIVNSVNGLFEPLAIKEVEVEDNPGQHGSLIDLSGLRYEARSIAIKLYFYPKHGTAKEQRDAFVAEFVGSTPKRLERIEDGKIEVWDVVFSSTSLNFIKLKLEELTLYLIESAPIKAVYRVKGSLSLFTLSAKGLGDVQQPIRISWGDGSFSDNCRAGSFDKIYDDGKSVHYVILSGVMEEVNVTTEHTKLYEVKY